MIAQITAGDAASQLEAGEIRLIDVRTAEEYAYVSVEGGEFLTPGLVDELRELPRDTPLAFLCHHGVRSHQAAAWFASEGFSDVRNVVGGIEAWALEVDPGLRRY